MILNILTLLGIWHLAILLLVGLDDFVETDRAVPILVEVSESLYEVVTGVSGSPGTNGLDKSLIYSQ